MRRILLLAAAMGAGVAVCLAWWQALTGFDEVSKVSEKLRVTALLRTLRPGQSAQLAVRRKRSLLFDEPLQHPEQTTYFTTSESALVVEPDGVVTCVGTHKQDSEVVWVSAENGRESGHVSFNLLARGPGPTLDIVAEKPTAVPFPDFMTRYAPCCSGDPILMKEGETAHYRVIRHEAPHDDLTTKAAYTLFFGSGIPNDTRPSITTGGHDYVTYRTFHVDPQHGILIPPASIARNNFERVVVFVRYGNLVGWKYVIIKHTEEDGLEGHLRLHPEER